MFFDVGTAEDLLAIRPLAFELDFSAEQVFDGFALVQNRFPSDACVVVFLEAMVETIVAVKVLEASASVPKVLLAIAEIVVATMITQRPQILVLSKINETIIFS